MDFEDIFKGRKLNYQVKYAAFSHKGKVPDKNQDNFWCKGLFLERENQGLTEILSGEMKTGKDPAFVVFDGISGGQQGETAAYVAARKFGDCYKKITLKTDDEREAFVRETCFAMNDEVCDYAKGHHIQCTGTTTAILMFGREKIIACNLGDSRVYRLSKGTLRQLSQDHIEDSIESKKAPLTQHLGIPRDKFSLEPFVTTADYQQYDRYLICSDGLTDMLSHEEIGRILVEGEVSEVAKALVERALEKGGVDNITVLVCEVEKGERIKGRIKKAVEGIKGKENKEEYAAMKRRYS